MRNCKIICIFLSFMILTVFLASCTSSNAAKTKSMTKEPTKETLNTKSVSFKNPKIVTVKEMKVYYIHSTTSYESQYRSLWTAKVEAAHRGWTLVDLQYENASEYLDLFNTALNDPKTTAIICGIVAGFEGYQSSVAEARNKGIGVYTIDNVSIPGVICNTEMPNGVASLELAYKIGGQFSWNLKYCILTAKAARVHMERSEPVKVLSTLFNNMKLLAYDDSSSNSAASTLTSFDIVKAWLQKYDNINWIFSTNDNNAINAAEAIRAAGRTNKTFSTGFGGGSNCWAYIRKNTPLKYSYAQPYELMTHSIFEVIEETQVKGILPGQKGSTIPKEGSTLYYSGVVVGPDNVPDIGKPIHSVFSYYNPDDKNAWYNWIDGPGILYVTDGTTK